jgi:glycosyltransferase involved in cell wall biosynthesis
LERHLPNIDLFISPSRSTIEQHRRRGFEYPMRHLPLFLPATDVGTGDSQTHGGHRPYFLFVGRLVKIKGVQTLIEIFTRYEAADLVIAGDGPYEEELRRQADSVPNVRFLGRVPHDELRNIYGGAVALLVPSLVYETFGFITLESLAQKTPVIARDLGAVSELVRDTGGGMTYRTQEELVEAMTLLQSNQELRDSMAEAGYQATVTRYSEDQHLETYFELIEEADAKRRSGRTLGSAS